MSDPILTSMAAVMNALNLYPPGHPTCVQQLNQCYVHTAKALAGGPLSVAVADDVMVLGGQPLYDESKPVMRIKEAMVEMGWTLLTIQPSLSREELLAFIQQLLKPSKSLQDVGKLRAWVEANRIANIDFAQLEVESSQPDPNKQRARQVYQKARDVVKNVMAEARLGKIPDAGQVFEAVHQMSDIILTDSDALLGLVMLKDYDEYTFTHSVNVGALSLALAKELGFKEPELTSIGVAGLLHDVGKTKTPLEILNKPSKLTEEEWTIMKQHPVSSFQIVQQMKNMTPYAVDSVRQHHCRYDRTGYPTLQKDEEFLSGAQIVAIADCYDGMTTQRGYQKCYDPKESLEVMTNKLAGSSLNPEYLKAFIDLLGIYPIGAVVRLDTGEVAVVTGRGKSRQPTRPVVKLVYDAMGSPFTEEVYVDLADQTGELGQRAIVSEVRTGALPIQLSDHL